MIDLHSHILPGIDDGSKSTKMSIEMLRRSARQGVTVMAATPHFYPMHNTPERFLQQRQEAIDRLGPLPEGVPQVIFGAEVAYFDGISRSQELIDLQLGNTGLLLVEMPFCSWTGRMIEELREIESSLGLTPVLAHIDRYQGKHQYPRYSDLLEEYGVLLQCNSEGFRGFFSRRRMLKLLSQEKIHFLGSDCHNLDTRPPNMRPAAKVIGQKLGKQAMDDLTQRSKTLLGL